MVACVLMAVGVFFAFTVWWRWGKQFYVCPRTGSDAAKGSRSRPFRTFRKTMGAVGSRVATGRIVTVHILSDAPASDPLIIECVLGRWSILKFQGRPTCGTDYVRNHVRDRLKGAQGDQ